jgi:predicted alpha/beta hydrolase
MIRIYGYGAMKKIGWGENLGSNMMKEWREWCLSKSYFTGMLNRKLRMDKFYDFTIPITAVYISDDYIAYDKTVPLMMKFFPNSPQETYKLSVTEHTIHKVGHTGIFRKKFENDLWPLLTGIIEK